MESKLILIASSAASLWLAAGAFGQFDVTPQPGTYLGEGTPFPCIRFRDGSSVVRFMPPADWRFTAQDKRCEFQPVGVAQATGTMTVRAVNPDQPSAEERMADLLQAVIPEGATNISPIVKDLPQVKFDKWPSIHQQVEYEHFGQKFRVALVVVPLKTEELHIRFGARAADFARVFPALFESLGTFTWDPAEEAGAKPAARN